MAIVDLSCNNQKKPKENLPMKTKPTYGNIRVGKIIVKFETTDPIVPSNPAILSALSTITKLWEKTNKETTKAKE